MEETEQQTPAPWGIQNRTHIAHVEGRGLRSKLLHLRVGNAPQKGLRGENRFEPGETLRPLSEVFQRGLARGIFDPCELAPPGMDGEEASRRVFSASLRATVIRV